MKFIKRCCQVLLVMLLFLSLTVFGLLFTARQMALNSTVASGIIRDIDFADITRVILEEDTSVPAPETLEMRASLIAAVENLQPVIKERLYIAVDDTYAYFNGKRNSPDLKAVLGDSLLNADSLEKVLAGIDIVDIVESSLLEQSANDDAQVLQRSLLHTLRETEAEFKTQLAAASGPVFEYVLGQTDTIDLPATMRNTILSNDFIDDVIGHIDFKPIIKDVLREQFDQLPAGIKLNEEQLDRLVLTVEATLTNTLQTAAGPVADYLVGRTSSLSIEVSFSHLLNDFRPIIMEAYMSELPASLQDAPQSTIDNAANAYWNNIAANFTWEITLDETALGAGIDTGIPSLLNNLEENLDQLRVDIDESITSLEEEMRNIRVITDQIKIAFWGVLALLLLLIGAIILLHRAVSPSARDLGITFTVYGVLFFIGVLVTRALAPSLILTAAERNDDLPKFAADLIPTLVKHFTSPLFIFSLVCLLVGIALIVVAVIYPKMKVGKGAVHPASPTAE